MADGVTPPPQYHAGKRDERTFGEYLSEFVAYYMAIGMSRDEVLYGERATFYDYDKAFEYKQVQANKMSHLNGFYDYLAVSCALSSAFAGKGKKGTPYPQYPVPITETEREEEKRRNIERTLAFVRGRKRNGDR